MLPTSIQYLGNNEAQYKATVADIKLAYEALTNVKAPFQLSTAGWVLGPAHDRAALDAIDREITAAIDAAVEFATQSEFPAIEEMYEDVYVSEGLNR